jgi:galactitol PTS system EIIA component
VKIGQDRLGKIFQITAERSLFYQRLRAINKFGLNGIYRLVMEKTIFSNISILRISDKTRDGALQQLADHMIAAGYARPGYDEAVISRENTYPTGLHTSGVEIAIPHADAEWTLQPALVIGLLDQPVVFQPMGGQGSEVQASLIFMLTLSDPSAHIDFLRAFSKVIEDEEVMNQYQQTRDIQLLLNRLRLEYSAASTSIRPSV